MRFSLFIIDLSTPASEGQRKIQNIKISISKNLTGLGCLIALILSAGCGEESNRKPSNPDRLSNANSQSEVYVSEEQLIKHPSPEVASAFAMADLQCKFESFVATATNIAPQIQRKKFAPQNPYNSLEDRIKYKSEILARSNAITQFSLPIETNYSCRITVTDAKPRKKTGATIGYSYAVLKRGYISGETKRVYISGGSRKTMNDVPYKKQPYGFIEAHQRWYRASLSTLLYGTNQIDLPHETDSIDYVFKYGKITDISNRSIPLQDSEKSAEIWAQLLSWIDDQNAFQKWVVEMNEGRIPSSQYGKLTYNPENKSIDTDIGIVRFFIWRESQNQAEQLRSYGSELNGNPDVIFGSGSPAHNLDNTAKINGKIDFAFSTNHLMCVVSEIKNDGIQYSTWKSETGLNKNYTVNLELRQYSIISGIKSK
jgi:hypothetical protein